MLMLDSLSTEWILRYKLCMKIKLPFLLFLAIATQAMEAYTQSPVSGKVEPYNNRPTIFINNKPEYP